MMRVQFKPNQRASCFHAVDAVARGRSLVDPQLGADFTRCAADFCTQVEACGATPTILFDHLVPLAADPYSDRQLAEVALAKVLPRQQALDRADIVSRSIAGANAAFKRAKPEGSRELDARVEPLMYQWQARGPGLLATIGELTEPDVLTDEADVIIVHPVTGGGGRAHLRYNSARIEGVLADPIAELPEVVRLGWLLSLLNLDLGRYTDGLRHNRVETLAPLAMLPVVLAAAARVDLIAPAATSVAHTLDAWHIHHPRLSAAQLAPVLDSWWDTCWQTDFRLATALAALDRMLAQD